MPKPSCLCADAPCFQEYHLQTILKDAGTSNDQEIPVPPPQESDINYDVLYPSQFHKPSSYIRFSQTVEECISCQYDMTIEDDTFLKSYNGKPPPAGALPEDDFERIMEVYEDTAAEQTPFASVDNTVVAYDMVVPALNELGSASIMQHAKAVYEYWKSRRQEMGNKPLHPTLKFETHQDTDDTDPYVCFRRREARQTRKTRGRDNKVAETLKRLRRELEDGRQLVLLSYEREMMKRELLHMDRAVFEERARLKQIKLKLGIKVDDEDLVNQKVCALAPLHSARFPLGANTACSPRNVSRSNLPAPNGRQALHKSAPQSDQMVGQWKRTSLCWRTSWPRRKTSSAMKSRQRSRIIAGGTRIILISLEILCRR